MKKILFICIITLLLTGCFDYHEINDLLVIDSIGVDYIDKEYYVYLDIVSSDNNKISNKTIVGNDSDIANAFNKVIGNNSVLFDHVNLLVLSENVTNYGIYDVLDYLFRDINMNSNYHISVCNNIEECLSNNSEILNIVKDDYKSDDIISSLISKRKNIGIKYIDIFDSISSNKTMLFKDDRSSFLIDNKMYDFLVLNKNNILFDKYDNSINIYRHNVSYDVFKDKIIININGYGNVKKINKNIDLSKYDSYERINTIINSEIYDESISFINNCINSDIDILGFKDLYYRKYNKLINNISYELNVNIKINKNGYIYEVLYE